MSAAGMGKGFTFDTRLAWGYPSSVSTQGYHLNVIIFNPFIRVHRCTGLVALFDPWGAIQPFPTGLYVHILNAHIDWHIRITLLSWWGLAARGG